MDSDDAIDVDADAAIEIDAGGTLSLGANAASDFTTLTGALTLSGAGGVTVTSTEGTLALNGTGQAVNLNATNFTVTDAGNTAIDAVILSLDGTDNTNLTMTANNSSNKTMTIAATNSDGTGKGLIDMDADGTIAIDAAGLLSLGGGDASDFTTTSGLLTLEGDDGVVINSATTVGVTIDAATAGNVEINSANGLIKIGHDNIGQNIEIGTAGARNIMVGNTLATKVQLDAIALDMNATLGAITMDATGAETGDIFLNAGDDATIDATGLISLDAAAASNITTSAGDLTLQGDAGVVINSATSVGVTIDAATAGNVEINSAAGTILIGDDAVNQNIALGTGGARTINVGNTAATELQLDAILLDMNATLGAITMDATGAATGAATVGASAIEFGSRSVEVLNRNIYAALAITTTAISA